MTRKKKPFMHPALINSSYTVLFVGFTSFWAYIFSGYFPPNLQPQAYILCAAFALMLFVFRYIINQFFDGVTVLKFIVAYFSLIAVTSTLSAVAGPLSNETIPVISFLFLNAGVIAQAGPSLVMASVFPFYGVVTLAATVFSVAIVEIIYSLLFPVLPKAIRKSLSNIDSKVDKTATLASDKAFFEQQRIGITVASLLLTGYLVLFCILLLI